MERAPSTVLFFADVREAVSTSNRKRAGKASASKAHRASWVSTDAVAAVVEWLLSEDAAPVTGAAIPAG